GHVRRACAEALLSHTAVCPASPSKQLGAHVMPTVHQGHAPSRFRLDPHSKTPCSRLPLKTSLKTLSFQTSPVSYASAATLADGDPRDRAPQSLPWSLWLHLTQDPLPR